MSEDCHPTESNLSRLVREVKEQEDKRDAEENERQEQAIWRATIEHKDNLVWLNDYTEPQFCYSDGVELRLIMEMLP
jgi:hypothetical protein